MLHGIEHLETILQYIIDKLNNVPDVEEEDTEQQGPMHAAGGAHTHTHTRDESTETETAASGQKRKAGGLDVVKTSLTQLKLLAWI